MFDNTILVNLSSMRHVYSLVCLEFSYLSNFIYCISLLILVFLTEFSIRCAKCIFLSFVFLWVIRRTLQYLVPNCTSIELNDVVNSIRNYK